MSKTYSAGIVTAYGAAKRAGYQGTYEDFCRQQAGYAESAAAVEQAKNTAVSAANTATTKAGEAATAATAAQTAKTQTEQTASQALTDISTARSGAISAVQTEGATQTANATAQAQAAATSATTASAKASEASASATSAGQSATNAAASATSAANAASAAQSVLESIPQDYSELSEDVDKLKADLDEQQTGIDKLNEEMGVAVPDEYNVTTEGANVAVNIAEGLSFDLGTAYHFKFSISEPQVTATYFWLYRDAEHQLFSMTIPAGQTSVERNYTTSASTAVTDGYITMKVNVANVSGTVEISYVVDPPTRIDTIETLGIETKDEADGNKAEISQISVSLNKLNPLTITDGKYINKTGQVGNDITMFYTDFIPVKQGDRVNIVYDGVNSNAVQFRWLTAYNAQKNVLSELGWESSWAYNVPAGVSFVRITLYKTNLEGGKLAINVNAVYPYSAYGDAVPALENVYNVLNSPYTTLPDYILGGAWYKPLGSLEKGYFCMVTDDGKIGMNEYTIPMVLAKGVPCTFAIMSTSEVMADQTNIDIVKNAIAQGCSVAQHGGPRWTTYTEKSLNAFFDAEQAFFDSIGIEVRGAVIPEHYNSKLIFAVAGGRYGVVRSGMNGHNFPTVNHYDNYTSGARSNLYGLSSYNIIDKTLADNKAAVDYAIANKKLMIVYIHEQGLTDNNKTVIEGLLDYVVSSGITAITLGDIPTIL